MTSDKGLLPRRFTMPSSSSPLDVQAELIEAPEEFHHYEQRNVDDGVIIPFPSHNPSRLPMEAFNGIFNYLMHQCHGNPAKVGQVSISGNSFNSGYARILPHLLDPAWRGFWTSTNENGSYISIDFLEHKVSVAGYALRTYHGNADWRHLRSWVLEGSNGMGWKEIHVVKRSSKLNGPQKVAGFKCLKVGAQQNFYQTIRLRLTDKNFYGDYFLNLSGIELFGILD